MQWFLTVEGISGGSSYDHIDAGVGKKAMKEAEKYADVSEIAELFKGLANKPVK
ncbi:hypothetical protein [Luteolibacter sp. AS25]|uniref:hypothetical protein n=1 Tax=Luteolibacter sp. AS25 TaxID=3135776 RepID=UPI00398AE396